MNRNQRVWEVVRAIPEGQVATYGQVAEAASIPGRSAARQVGYALAALNGENAPDDVPWHRVINAGGRVSERGDPDRTEYQRVLLEAEGIEFGPGLSIDLDRYQWHSET